jgi:hypothetical protein
MQLLGVPVIGPGKAFGNSSLTERVGAPEFDAEDEAIAVLLGVCSRRGGERTAARNYHALPETG